MMTEIQTGIALQDFLASHAICRVWYSGVDSPTGVEHTLNDDCDSEQLIGVLTDWLSLDLDRVEGTVTQDSDGEFRWEWRGGEDLRNSRGNSIYRLIVWGRA